MRYAILTSNDIRHRYFVNALRKRRRPVAVCYQNTGYQPAETKPQEPSEEVAAALKHHFDERRRQEARFFGGDAAFLEDSADVRVGHVTTGTLNSTETLAFLGEAGADSVVVYGTSLIKPPLLGAFDGRMINMHLGLSPYYRGTATNFYPLVNDEPEYVGVTIHHVDAGIDSGDILHQARPEITADDMPHTVGCKAILVGIDLVARTLDELASGTLRGVPQWEVENPRLYLRKDYRPEHVLKLYRMIDAGLFPRYVARKAAVQGRVTLVP